MPDSGKTARAQLHAIALIVVVLIAACTIVYVFDEGGGVNVAAFITPLLGFGATVVALLGTLGPLKRQVEKVDEKVDYLANGGTDAKIRAGIADVVRDEFLKDDAEEQLSVDRAHRDASPSSHNNNRTAALDAANAAATKDG